MTVEKVERERTTVPHNFYCGPFRTVHEGKCVLSEGPHVHLVFKEQT